MELPLTGAEPVDELLEEFPQARTWLGDHGLICVQCGEVYWGSLESLAKSKGLGQVRFTEVLEGLNVYLSDN